VHLVAGEQARRTEELVFEEENLEGLVVLNLR
jgi:hypothetical protein